MDKGKRLPLEDVVGTIAALHNAVEFLVRYRLVARDVDVAQNRHTEQCRTQILSVIHL